MAYRFHKDILRPRARCVGTACEAGERPPQFIVDSGQADYPHIT